MPILDQISKLDKILILGFAREGKSTLKFLQNRFPQLTIDTTDQKDGPDYLKNLSSYALIIKTPGTSPHLPEIIKAKKDGVVFTSQTQIFLESCPSKKTIGITGTKGKSTTASLLYHVFHSNHLPSILVGNIGTPPLDYLSDITSDTWVVMELSSYQLMDLYHSPHIAVLQNIYPDHLDYHLSYEEYKQAKYNIARFQSPKDYFLYNSDNADATTAAQFTSAHKIPFSRTDFDPNIVSQLLGQSNHYNILPSVIIGKLIGLNQNQIYSAIKSFQPLETRLQLITTAHNIRFYADALATIPEATIAALDALGTDVHTLIVGGYERKQQYSQLAKEIISSNIRSLILLPSTGSRIWQEVQKANRHGKPISHFFASSMPEAVELAFKHTPPGKICLLSPAAPSFTLFKDYHDEHNQYQSAITNFTHV